MESARGWFLDLSGLVLLNPVMVVLSWQVFGCSNLDSRRVFRFLDTDDAVMLYMWSAFAVPLVGLIIA